ncbi:MAG: histidinol-phosphate transaminase [Leptospiraceae bacterium]|nr:histidinol-phosphate transaminase [Leptospiraceae bacterium]MCP5511256.1 histidinol-phosphate transaminase [Leptospiraceae bacterium]
MKDLFQKELYQIHAYVPGEQPPPESRIVKLNTNENPYPPSPQIAKSIRKILKDGLLRKYPSPDSAPLRVALADHFGLKKENFLITNGSDEGLSLLFRSILSPESTVVMPYPTYSLYPILTDLELNSSKTKKIPLKSDFHFDMEALERAEGNLLTFAHPNAPTGIREDKNSLLNLISHFNGMVLCDEAYIDFAEPDTSLIREVVNHKNLIVSRTFSKSYSLAGLRVGFLVGSEENISLISKIKDSYNLGLLEQVIALTSFLDQKYHKKTLEKIIHSREKLKVALEKMGYSVLKSETNFLFAKPPEGVDPALLFNYLKQNDIYIRYFSDEYCREYIRISIGKPGENKKLLSVLKSYQR